MKTKQKPIISNMQSDNGNPVPNQFLVNDGKYTHFKSYGTYIAREDNNSGRIEVDADNWSYSRTTLKYLCKFLRLPNKKAIEQAIKNNKLTLTELN